MAATILLLVYKQWGLGNPSINFPIAFPKECFIAAITRAAGNYEHSIVITTKNKTNLSWICKGYDNSAGNTYANWLALGCQLQWGYYVESQNPTDYRYWSIPFTSHYITIATKTYYEPKEEAVPWLVGIDMQKFICGYGANFIGSSYVSCVGIGCQPQWGYGNSESTQTFPIKFTNSVIGIYGSKRAINYEYTFAATSITNTNFFMSTRNSEGNSRVIACNWLAIGQQQTK